MNNKLSLFTKKTLTIIMVMAMVFTLVPMIPAGDIVDEAQASVYHHVYILGGELIVSDSDYYISGSDWCVQIPATEGDVSVTNGTVTYGNFTYDAIYYDKDNGVLVITNGNIVASVLNYDTENAPLICEGVTISNSDLTIETTKMTKDDFYDLYNDSASDSNGTVSDFGLSKYPYDVYGIGCLMAEVTIYNSTLNIYGALITEGGSLNIIESDINISGGQTIIVYCSILAIFTTIHMDGNSKLTADSGIICFDFVTGYECEYGLFVSNSTLNVGTIKLMDGYIERKASTKKPFFEFLASSGNLPIKEVCILSLTDNYSFDKDTIVNFQSQPIPTRLSLELLSKGYIKSAIVFVPNQSTGTQSLYLPDPYVEAADGTLHRSSEVNFYNAQLHQKEVASVQEAAKDWKTQCRTKAAKKGIRTYCYLDGIATEELQSFIDKGYTVTYDWYKANGKGKKFKYVDSTYKNSFLDKSVKKGKYYEYKVKINLWDEDGVVYKSTLADCTKGFRTF